MDEATDTRELINQLSRRVHELEQHIGTLDQNKNRQAPAAEPLPRPGLAYFFAEHINSVVGLKEALTWTHRPFRVIWATLVAVGLAGTVFYIFVNTKGYLNRETATKSGLQHSASYAYPPLVVCPPWPFDLDHLQSRGLSKDALTYSLGYYYLISAYSDNNVFAEALLQIVNRVPENETSFHKIISDGKEQFMQFYKNENFGSLDEYFQDISADISMGDENSTLYFPDPNSCTGCMKSANGTFESISFLWNKVISELAVCYTIPFYDAEIRSAQSSASVGLRNRDRSNGLKRTSPNWRLYFSFESNLNELATILEPSIAYTIRINALRIIMLKNDACVDPTDPGFSGYDQRACIKICQNQRVLAAGISKHTAHIKTDRPQDACNVFDYVTAIINTALRHQDIDEETENLTAPELENIAFSSFGLNYTAMAAIEGVNGQRATDLDYCFKKCLPTCDRVVYDISVTRNERFEDDTEDESAMSVSIIHSALSQGGIMTLQEIPTMTFGEYVSTVGGTLGIFLGCSVMTLAQLVFSIVRYAVGISRRDRSSEMAARSGNDVVKLQWSSALL